MDKKRPVAVIVFSTVYVLIGLIMIPACVMVVLRYLIGYENMFHVYDRWKALFYPSGLMVHLFGPFVGILPLMIPLVALLFIVSGVGIFFLREWARRCIVSFSRILLILLILNFIWTWWFADKAGLTLVALIFVIFRLILLSFLFLLFTIYFFTRPKVKEQFK